MSSMGRVVATLAAACGAIVIGCSAEKSAPATMVMPKQETAPSTPKTEVPAVAPNFATALQIAPTFSAETSTLNVALTIAPGFHAYAPGEEVGVPVNLSLTPGSWTLDGDVGIPKGQVLELGDEGKSVVLTGNVVVTAKIKGGTGPVEGSILVQICTETTCDRPREHAFSVKTSSS